MLVIGKAPEFGPNDLPVRGQCQPHTKGWVLRWFSRGQEKVLFTDNYYTCRELQRACLGLSLEDSKVKIAEIAASFASDMQETQKVQIVPPDRDDTDTLPLGEETPVDLPVVGIDDSETVCEDTTEFMDTDDMIERIERHKQDDS